MKKKLIVILSSVILLFVLVFSIKINANESEVSNVNVKKIEIENPKGNEVVNEKLKIVKQDNLKVKQGKTKTEQENNNVNSIIGSLDFDTDDALRLHKIAIAEAGGESVESMALVMLVVLNRTWSDKFPNSIEEVIFQKNNGVAQFSPTINGSYNKAQPNEKSKKAMDLILSGWNESKNALYFESCSGDSWHSRNLEFLFEKDGIKFYK